jgi:EpsI family protein
MLSAPATINGWVLGARPVDWSAQFDGAGDRRDWSWQASNGARVDATLVAYPRQQDGAEMVGYGQGAVAPDSDWRWSEDLPDIGNGAVARIMSFGRPRDVLTVYRIGGTVTASPRQVKLLALKARFSGGDERGYALVLSARPVGQMNGRAQIERLVSDAGGVDALVTRLTTAQ